nr:MAG TPA: hypothetical protein [Caudoviricetes sp.]
MGREKSPSGKRGESVGICFVCFVCCCVSRLSVSFVCLLLVQAFRLSVVRLFRRSGRKAGIWGVLGHSFACCCAVSLFRSLSCVFGRN